MSKLDKIYWQGDMPLLDGSTRRAAVRANSIAGLGRILQNYRKDNRVPGKSWLVKHGTIISYIASDKVRSACDKWPGQPIIADKKYDQYVPIWLEGWHPPVHSVDCPENMWFKKLLEEFFGLEIVVENVHNRGDYHFIVMSPAGKELGRTSSRFNEYPPTTPNWGYWGAWGTLIGCFMHPYCDGLEYLRKNLRDRIERAGFGGVIQKERKDV